MFKKLIATSCFALILSGTLATPAQAFQPASHYVLQETVADKLPADSIIKKALEAHPDIAAWGATAPDLGYLQIRTAFEYAPWADRYHYYKVGSMAQELLEEALASGDLKEIAFAAGWVTHVTGDMGCHGLYVNREAGVYFENPEGRPLHKELEKFAEPFVWHEFGNHPLDQYKNLNTIFADKNDIPYNLILNATQKVYGISPSESEMKGWESLLEFGLKTGIGYSYKDYDEAVKFLSNNDRVKALRDGFNYGVDRAVELLTEGEKGDYHQFSNRWNLDVFPSVNPIASLTVTIDTGNSFGAGTDDDVYFGMIVNKDGQEKKLEWLLDKPGYNDFERRDHDEYYLYINEKGLTPEMVQSIYIKKVDNGSLGGDWHLQNVEINMNGKIALNQVVNKIINDKNDTWITPVNWHSDTLNTTY